jgi:integrase
MARGNLTKRVVDNAKPRAQRYELSDGVNGLYLAVQPSGGKSWIVRYRFGSKPRKYTIGAYSENAWSLDKAQKEAAKVIMKVDGGEDPAAAKQAENKARRAPKEPDERPKTFEDTARRFLLRHTRMNCSNRHFLETARLFGFKPDPADETKLVHNAYAKAFIKQWEDRAIASITEQEIQDFLDEVVIAGTPILANNMHTALGKFFRWAKAPEGNRVIAINPCLEIKQPVEDEEGERVLSDAELRALWRAAARLEYPKGTAYRMLILSGQRKSIITLCRAAQVDRRASLWTISSKQEGAKGTANLLPIVDAMAAVFDECNGNAPYLFSTTGGAKPLTLGAKIKKEIDALMLDELRKEAAAQGDDPAAVELMPWDNHDIRRTMRTRLSALPIPDGHIVRELVIGHRKGKIHRTYDKFSYVEQEKRALELWAEKLETIVNPPEGNIIQFQKQAAQ